MSDQVNPAIVEISEVIECLKVSIRNEYLSSYKTPAWSLEKNYFKNNVGKMLQKTYMNRDKTLEDIFPKNTLLTLAVLLVLSFDAVYILLFAFIPNIGGISGFPRQALFLFITFLMIILVLYSSVGAYWTIIELLLNKELSKKILYLIIFIMSISVATWFILGSPRTWNAEFFDNRESIGELLLFLGHTNTYKFLSTIFIYIPAITHGALWLIKNVTIICLITLNIVRWLGKIPTLQSTSEIISFLEKPIDCNGKTIIFHKLDSSRIKLIHEWAISRQQIIQNKLIPITMILAVLALIFSTDLGDQFVMIVKNIVIEYLEANTEGMFAFFNAFVKLVFIVVIFMFPIATVAKLLNESFTVDFMVGVCIFSRYSQDVNEIENEKMGCLSSIIKKIIK